MLNEIIITIASIAIRKYSFKQYKQKHKQEEWYKEYENNISAIEALYKETSHWHGTGRFHYLHKGSNKYEGVDFNQTFDILESIIKAGGIIPSQDPYLHIEGTTGTTISLTRCRPYARIYAQFNQYNKDSLNYLFGSAKFWFFTLFTIQLKEIIKVRGINIIREVLWTLQKDTVDTYQPWVNSFRKDAPRVNPYNFYKLTSDIPQNYGILFGIKKDSITVKPLHSAMERFETRTEEMIPLENITHIEVALKHADKTIEFLQQYNCNIPVIPIEFFEIYSNTLPLARLIQ